MELPNVLRLEATHRQRTPLGALLHAEGAITIAQLEAALDEVERIGRRLGQVLLDCGAITQRQLASALAAQAKLQFVDLDELHVEPTAAALVSEELDGEALRCCGRAGHVDPAAGRRPARGRGDLGRQRDPPRHRRPVGLKGTA